MSKTKAGPIAADRLKSFIERIERIEEEQAAIAGDKRDIYAEAKGVGYDVKTMRKVVALRKMDAADRDEQETLLDTYLHALGMVDRIDARLAAGESQREVAAAEGVSKSTVQRRGPKTKAALDTSEMDQPTYDADGVIESLPSATNNEPAEMPVAEESNAGPQGCVDGLSGSLAPEPIVPPSTNPQAGCVGALPVTPEPERGIGTGTIHEPVFGQVTAEDMAWAEEEARKLGLQGPIAAVPATGPQTRNAPGEEGVSKVLRVSEGVEELPSADHGGLPVGMGEGNQPVAGNAIVRPACEQVNAEHNSTVSAPEKGKDRDHIAAVPNPDEDKLEYPDFLRRSSPQERGGEGRSLVQPQ